MRALWASYCVRLLLLLRLLDEQFCNKKKQRTGIAEVSPMQTQARFIYRS